LEEGKGKSGYRLLKMDLSKTQPRALLEKDGKQHGSGYELVKVLHPEILSTPSRKAAPSL
jgi:hypothetical protein